MKLSQGTTGVGYRIASLHTDDEELENFLLTLGCYEGEVIRIVSTTGNHFTLSIRDGRYTVDNHLAEAILVEDPLS